MNPRLSLLRAAVAAGAAATFVGLGGCVSLLPKQAPVQLYTFGASPTVATAATDGVTVGRGQPVLGVILSSVSLPRAAVGDGILTLTGDKAAYIAGARWLSPAVLIFQQDAEQAFEARGQGVRLLDRGQLGAASALLRLDVRDFAVRYDPAGAAPPSVVVSLRATLTRADGGQVLERGFSVAQPASENRVSAIVAAYDTAVQTVLGQVVDWTGASVPQVAASLDPDAPTRLPPSPRAQRARPRP